MSEPIVIIGGGQAAGQFLTTLRRAGDKTPAVMVCAEPHPPYRRPPLSKAHLAGETPVDALYLQPVAAYARMDCRLLTEVRAEEIDRGAKTVRLSNGENLVYSRLALATGARLRRLTVPGAEREGVHHLRDIADVARLKADLDRVERAVVVGGGFIGLEAASVLRKLGKQVTVLEAADRLMARAVSEDLSAHMASLHRAQGVDVRLGAMLKTIDGADRVRSVTATDGARIPADLVLAGVGVTAEDGLAKAAGLVCENGVRVDAACRTSDPAVLAFGDCANFDHPVYGSKLRLESVQNAVDQAKTAARTAAGEEAAYDATPWFWSEQAGVTIQIAGLIQGADRFVKRLLENGSGFSIFGFRGESLRVVESIDAAAHHMIARKLLSGKAAISPKQAGDPEFDLKSALGAG